MGRAVAVGSRALAHRIRGFFKRRLRGGPARRALAAFAASCRDAGRQPAAVLLLERLGDFVAASALVGLVRERDPGLRIVWLGRARYRELALLVPGVEDYVEVDCYGELERVVRRLGGFRVFDLNLNGKSCACCGVSWRNLSGESTVDTDNYYEFGPLAAAFARVAGIAWAERAPELALGPDRGRRPELLRPYAVVHSESEESARNWHEDGWRAAARALLEDTGLTVVHVGVGPAGWLPRHERAVDLAGQTSVMELLAIVRDCELFVGIDSSVAHVANAFRRPGLVLLGRYRRFSRYWPYTGFYGRAAGGALLVRFPSECPFVPAAVADRALRAVCRRLADAGPDAARPGAGGPWDVRLHEVDGDPRALLQDATCDVAAVLAVDDDEDAAIARWPGSPDEVVLAFDAERFAARARELGGAQRLVDRLESLGARFAIDGDGASVPPSPPGAATASYRYLRYAGRPVVLGAAGCPDLLTLESPELAAAPAVTSVRWYRSDAPGSGAEPAELGHLHARIAAERRLAGGEPAAGAPVESERDGLRAALDEVARRPDGGLRQLSGWVLLESTGTPPAVVCLAEERGDGTLRARRAAPFSRLERPDVARALASPGASFSGLRLEVPADLQGLGSALAILVLDRERGSWRRLDLPG